MQVLDVLNSQIQLVTGKIQKIYAVDGTRIYNVDDLRPVNVLVANDDPFIKLRYNVMAIQHTHGVGLNGATLRNEFISKIRPITQRGRVRHHTEQEAASELPTKPNTSHKRKMSQQYNEPSGTESETEHSKTYTSTSKLKESTSNLKAESSSKLKEETGSKSRESSSKIA